MPKERGRCLREEKRRVGRSTVEEEGCHFSPSNQELFSFLLRIVLPQRREAKVSVAASKKERTEKSSPFCLNCGMRRRTNTQKLFLGFIPPANSKFAPHADIGKDLPCSFPLQCRFSQYHNEFTNIAQFLYCLPRAKVQNFRPCKVESAQFSHKNIFMDNENKKKSGAHFWSGKAQQKIEKKIREERRRRGREIQDKQWLPKALLLRRRRRRGERIVARRDQQEMERTKGGSERQGKFPFKGRGIMEQATKDSHGESNLPLAKINSQYYHRIRAFN